MAEQEHRAQRAPAMFVNPLVSHLQVSKLDLHAASTWSLLAKVSPISLQASLASVKFNCSAVFLVKRVTPTILHGPERVSSAKESHRSSVCCCPCSLPFLVEHYGLDRAVRSCWLGLKFRNNRTQARRFPPRTSCWVRWVLGLTQSVLIIRSESTALRVLAHSMEASATSSWGGG